MVNSDSNSTRLTPNLQTALELAGLGWYVFPCREKPGDPYTDKKTGELKTPQTKQPYTHAGKDDATTDPAIIRRWWSRWPGALVGIYCAKSGFFALDIDIDPEKGVDGKLTWAKLTEANGGVAAGPAQLTPRGGLHILFKLPADGLSIPNNAGKLAESWGGGLDLRSNGYICTGVLADGRRYQWLNKHGPETRLTDAPGWLLELIRNLGARAKKAVAPAPSAAGSPRLAASNSQRQPPGDFWLNYYLTRTVEGNRNDNGFMLALQLRDSGLAQSEAESYMREYARRVPGQGYTESEALASLGSAYKGSRRDPAQAFPGLTSGNGSHQASGTPPAGLVGQGQGPQPDSGPILLTELGNSRRFSRSYRGLAIHVKAWGWLTWNGQKWEIDETGRVMALGKRIVDGLFTEAQAALSESQSLAGQLQTAADSERDSLKARYEAAQKRANDLLKWAIQSQTAQKINAMLTLAESDLPARVDEFDANPWLLNCQNGTLDLKTGELRPHEQSNLITKLAGTVYDPAADCPTWLKFLNRVFDNDQELINWIQRAIGYSLTGLTSEQCFFFLYGSGRNGKSTFANTIAALLGDYFHKAQSQTFMLRSGQANGPTEGVAGLVGARFVSASELARGQRLDEQLVKDLTGGDLVPARRLYKSEFTFKPALKLWFYGNEKPQVSGTDEGIWRRVRLVPFTVVIPENEVDPGLPEKLAAELPGILAWSVRGCLAWQRQGLGSCKAVDNATKEYRQEEDVVAQFLAECCVLGPDKTATASALHTAFTRWGGGWSMKALSKELKRRGYKSHHERGGNCYSGIGLLESDDPQKPIL